MTTTGERIKQEREAKPMSQAQLAARVTRLGHKITQDGIAKLEKRGANRPRAAREISIVLNLDLDWLYTGKGQKERKETDFPLELWNVLKPSHKRVITNALKSFEEVQEIINAAAENLGTTGLIPPDENTLVTNFPSGKPEKNRGVRK